MILLRFNHMKIGFLVIGIAFIIIGASLFSTLPDQFLTSGSCVSWNNFVCTRYSTTTNPNPSYSTMITFAYITAILGFASLIFGIFLPNNKQKR
jgi:hypothetical protein